MPLSIATGGKEVESNPFPAPKESGFYMMTVTRVTEKAISKNDRIMRVALNLKCTTDAHGEKATGFATWSSMNIPPDLQEEFDSYNPTLQMRKFRNALRIIAEVSDEDLNSGEIEVDFADFRDVKVWGYVNVKERVYQGEVQIEGDVARFVTHEEVLRQTGQLTEEAGELGEGEGEGETEEETEEEVVEEEVVEEDEDEIPIVPPPAAKKTTTAATTSTKPAATTSAKPASAKPKK